MLIGAHVSVAGGLHNAVEKGTAIGADVLQIFVSGPQSFRTTAYSDSQIEEFKKLYQNAGFRGLFLHAIYLINLASENEDSVERSINSLLHYMNMGDKLGAVGTIVHLGSFGSLSSRRSSATERSQQILLDEIPHPHSGVPDDRGVEIVAYSARNDESDRFERMIQAIKEILSKTPASQKLIVENCAGNPTSLKLRGGNGKIGKDLDELVRIHQAVKSERLAFCIDAQHLFASGINVSDREIFGKWLNEFDTRIGIKKLVCIHANDSKTELSSGADRHENIGEGIIGLNGFKNILAQPLLQNIPFILEVPGVDKKGPDKKNIQKLHFLLKNP